MNASCLLKRLLLAGVAIGCTWNLALADESVSLPEPPASLAQTEMDAANAEAIPTRSLLDMILAGGPLLFPILVSSFILMVAVFERTISLRRARIVPRHFAKRLLHQLKEGSVSREDALTRCREHSSHVARVFAAAIRKWGKPAVEVEQAVLDEGERSAAELRKFLRVINGVATVSPLLGLLGTVWGMMEAFNAIAKSSAMGRPELLAAGISQALLTTAAGLFVAIPALVAYLYFTGRVDQLIMALDSYGQQLVELISAEGIAEREQNSVSAKPAKTEKGANPKRRAKKAA